VPTDDSAAEDKEYRQHRFTHQGDLVVRLIGEGQAQGEVREGPMERVGLPVFAALHGYADLVFGGYVKP